MSKINLNSPHVGAINIWLKKNLHFNLISIQLVTQSISLKLDNFKLEIFSCPQINLKDKSNFANRKSRLFINQIE